MLAVSLTKIAGDLALMGSGPRAGIGEILLPELQKGSSIMPGKVNPVIPELVNQICYQIIGYDVTISMASEASELELNMAEPIIARNCSVAEPAHRRRACYRGSTGSRVTGPAPTPRGATLAVATTLNGAIGYDEGAHIVEGDRQRGPWEVASKRA